MKKGLLDLHGVSPLPFCSLPSLLVKVFAETFGLLRKKERHFFEGKEMSLLLVAVKNVVFVFPFAENLFQGLGQGQSQTPKKRSAARAPSQRKMFLWFDHLGKRFFQKGVFGPY